MARRPRYHKHDPIHRVFDRCPRPARLAKRALRWLYLVRLAFSRTWLRRGRRRGDAAAGRGILAFCADQYRVSRLCADPLLRVLSCSPAYSSRGGQLAAPGSC